MPPTDSERGLNARDDAASQADSARDDRLLLAGRDRAMPCRSMTDATRGCADWLRASRVVWKCVWRSRNRRNES
jgi:hypothetical protein